jgi:hypothetical protein
MVIKDIQHPNDKKSSKPRPLQDTFSDDIQITSDYMSRWDVLKRRVGAVTSQWIIEVFFHVNILQCFFVLKNLRPMLLM